MKYFSNLSTRTYQTTIGEFNIVDMTSYYTVNDSDFETTTISIDNTETLIEAANNIYQDVDSFWLFLFANKTINPFTLLQENNTVAEKTAEGLTGIGMLTNLGTDAIFTAGSLIFPKTTNNGLTWSYGSTGNFSLTGGFALVDTVNPFSKRITIKYLQGFTFAADPNIYQGGLVKSNTGYTVFDTDKTAYVSELTKQIAVVDTVDYLTENDELFASVKSEYPLLKKSSPGTVPFYEPVGTGGISTTFQETFEDRITKIKAYLPSTIKNSAFVRVIQNYQV